MGITALRRYRNRIAAEPAAELARHREALAEQEAVVEPIGDEGSADEANREQHDEDLAEQAANAEQAEADGDAVESVHPTVQAAEPSEPSAEKPADPAVEQPARNASTADWQAYAEAVGGFPGDVSEASRTELVEHYTK